MNKSKIWSVLAVAAALLMMGAPVAMAQTAAQQGYDETGVLGDVEQPGGGGPAAVDSVPSDTVESSSSALPFTGLDVGILVVLGVAAVGTGFALRRVVRHRAA